MLWLLGELIGVNAKGVEDLLTEFVRFLECAVPTPPRVLGKASPLPCRRPHRLSADANPCCVPPPLARLAP